MISPARLRSIFHFATSPLGNRPVTLRPRRTNPAIPQPIPPLPSPRKYPKSRGINTSVASRGHGAAAVLCQVPDDRQATSARSDASVTGNNTKNGHGAKAYSSAKGRFFPLHALPGDAFPAVVIESSERHERDQKRAEKAWLVALSAPRQSCCMAPAGIGRLLQPAAGELSPLGNRARSSEVGDCRAGNSSGRLFACLCRGESLSGAAGGVVGMLFS